MRARMVGTAVLVGALAASAASAAGVSQAATMSSASSSSGVAVASTVGASAPTHKKPAPKKHAKKDAPGTAFTAYGKGFRVTVKRGILTIDDSGAGQRRVKVSRSAFAKGVEFTGRDRGREVALVVRSGRCVDTAGFDTGMRATYTYGPKTARGCAVAGAIPIADS